MTWAPSASVCRQQEPGAVGIFEHLRSVNWHFLKMKSLWVECPREKAPFPQIVLAWALAVGPDNINKLWAWLIALSETVKKAETPMTAFTFRSCWWNYQSLMPKTAEIIFYHVGFKIHINRLSSIFHIVPSNTSATSLLLTPIWQQARPWRGTASSSFHPPPTLPFAFCPLVASCLIPVQAFVREGKVVFATCLCCTQSNEPRTFMWSPTWYSDLRWDYKEDFLHSWQPSGKHTISEKQK